MVGQLDYLILINFAVVFQLLIYSSYLIYSKPGDTGSRSILLIIFFIFLVSKLDDLLQQSGAIWQVPDIAFLGTSLSLCLGPCIALYVNRRTQPNWQWQQRQLWHLSWLLVPIVYLFNNWWLYGSEEKLQLLRSGEFANTTTLLLLPSFGDFSIVVLPSDRRQCPAPAWRFNTPMVLERFAARACRPAQVIGDVCGYDAAASGLGVGSWQPARCTACMVVHGTVGQFSFSACQRALYRVCHPQTNIIRLPCARCC